MDRTPLVDLPPELATPQAPRPLIAAGVDGGATKTLAAVLDLERHAVYLGLAGPSNEDAVGGAAAVQALLAAADEAIERAGIAPKPIWGGAVAAVAGTNTTRGRCPRAFGQEQSPGRSWASRRGVGHGHRRRSRRRCDLRYRLERLRCGTGWTWLAGRGLGTPVLGDEGSGYWLGLESIRAALRDREASGPATALSDAAPRFFGVQSVEALAGCVYSKPLTKGEIAAFAVEAWRLAEEGDAVARELYESGARQLAAQVTTVIRQTELSGAFPVGLIGSVFKAGPIFVEPLAREIREHAPEAELATESRWRP